MIILNSMPEIHSVIMYNIQMVMYKIHKEIDMVNVFGSQKIAIGFLISIGMGISFYIYDYFGIFPTSEFSHSAFFYMAGTMLYFPIIFFITDIIMKASNNSKIKNDTKYPVDNSNKKIIIGIGVGFGLLFLVLLAIIIPATSNDIDGSIAPDVEFGHYQTGEIMKFGGLKMMPTTSFPRSSDAQYSADDTLFVVGIQVQNDYYKQSISYMVDEFTLIDGIGREFNPIDYSSDEQYDLDDFKMISPKSSLQKYLVFDIPYDSQLKYELKFGDVGLYCFKNC